MALRSLRVTCLLCCSLLWAGTGCTTLRPAHDAIHPAASLPATTPWDLAALSEPPKCEWVDQAGPVRSLYYQGLPYKGKATRVFAYYASPATLGAGAATGKGFPGVVLVHGGGGTAFKEWAELWAGRGYAAIAMDLAGCGPDKKRLADGGPDQSDETKFGAIDLPPGEQWTYHAVANVILAHSLLRSLKEVDARRTAVTGISWGGYLTCIAAGLDDRFQAAVPVYGCGFLQENSVWLARFEKMTPEQRDRWVRLWDPSMYIGSAVMPVFFLDGTNDFAYPLDSYAKTYGLVKSERNFRITINMPHGHPQGWAPIEIGLFVDEHLRGGKPLPAILSPKRGNDEVVANVRTRTSLVSAALHYTTEAGPINKRPWQTAPGRIEGSQIVVKAPPQEATIWFLTVTDERGAVVSSELVFGPKR
ncbi:MAG: alpha/beta fold hydrolase [Phycisphaerae bacterium]|nr:alpha/beta fold hydrolase [Phycisphaerae bacterium]